MKLTEEQKKRLKLLLGKSAESLTADEKTELATLKGLAATEGYDPAADEAPIDEKALAELIGKALTDKGLTAEGIQAAVKAAAGGAPLTGEKVSELITAALEKAGPAVDGKALAAEIVKALPGGITKDDVTAIFEKAMTEHRRVSKMEHSGFIEMPISHRAGNLSVGQKQLLNVCLMACTDEVLAQKNTKRPAHMNDGISDTVLRDATGRGASRVKAMTFEAAMGGKAITAGGAGSGLELMNIDISSDLQQRLFLQSQLAAALTANEINMPSNPFPLPMTTTRPTFYSTTETNGGTTSQPGTQAPILHAQKFIGTVPYSYEADEDSIIAILPMLTNALAAAAAQTLESAIINGDTSATHMDSDINAIANHCSKLFMGLRKLALAGSVTTDLSTGGISAANLKNLRKLMKKYGIQPKDLMIIAGTSGYNELVALPETLTVQNAGLGNARILTGVAPQIYGVDIIPSSECREDLNATGVYDGTTTTKGSIIIAHKPSWVMGAKQGFMIESFRDIINQKNTVVASFRRAFLGLETPAAGTTPTVVMGFNFAS